MAQTITLYNGDDSVVVEADRVVIEEDGVHVVPSESFRYWTEKGYSEVPPEPEEDEEEEAGEEETPQPKPRVRKKSS